MDQINNIELRDEAIFPDDAVLSAVLGPSFGQYSLLLDLFDRHGLSWEWRYYKDGKAWLCKVSQSGRTKKTRTIVWMSAWKGFMKATMYFPEKYAPGIYDLGIGEETKALLRNAKLVGKSTPCSFDITADSSLADFEAVMVYKIGCK